MNFVDLLKLLPIIGPVAASAEAFGTWWHQATAALHPADQATAKAALEDIRADNDAGHARLQAKLAAAAKR